MPDYNVIDLTSLSTSAGYVIPGTTAGGRSGTWVSSAGDINDDGIADLLIGAPGTGSGAGGAGRVHVIFGTNGPPRTSIDLAALSPTDGFTIVGQPNDSGSGELGSGTGINVSNAGDVNGDGIGDLIIGADRANPINNGNNGAAYVVYGRAGGTRADIALGALSPSDGFAIVGGLGGVGLDGSGSARLGFSVSGAGDVNGDGLADVIVGAPMAIGNGSDDNPAGQAFVIYGRAGPTRATVNVDALAPTDGFTITGDLFKPFAGASVSGAGDFNNDGLADVIVGAAPRSTGGDESRDGPIIPESSFNSGAYVIFGQAGASRGDVALDNLATYAGARIQVNASQFSSTDLGGDQNRIFGGTDRLLTFVESFLGGTTGIVATRVSSAGDVNDDGFADLVIGLPENYNRFNPQLGSRPIGSFIVYGRSGADLADFSVIGSANGSNQLHPGIDERDPSQLGYSVSHAGDINADGIDDLIVGRPGNISFPTGGFTYVVFGRAGGIGDLNLTNTLLTGPLTSDRGLTLVVDGFRSGDRAGTSVSAAGDVNGDGIADLIVGAPLSDDGGTNAGRSYVVYGSADFGAILGTADGETLTGTAGIDIINAKGGNDVIDGGAGGDLLRGGAGDDRYIVDDAGDRVVELLGEGTDTVESRISYILPSHVENLTYTGTGAATLTGNAANNVLDSGTSATGLVTLNGGEGDDTLIIRAGSFAVGIVGGAGNDTLRTERDAAVLPDDIENVFYIGTGNATLTGNGSDNGITGGAGNDTIDGVGGNDTLVGGGGNYTMTTGTGTALVYGGTGNDRLTITGTGGRLFGEDDNDILDSGTSTGFTELFGGDGDDTLILRAGTGGVGISGGAGIDTLEIERDLAIIPDDIENIVYTGTGNATLIGNGGANRITGGIGNDILVGGLGNDRLDGGTGIDTASYADAASAVSVNLASATAQNTLAAGSDTLVSIENLTGSAFNDRLIGNTGNNRLSGGGGNDFSTGGAGADTLDGGEGTDWLDGGLGADALTGGNGNDSYVVDNAGDTVDESATDGTDRVFVSISYMLGTNVENLDLTGSANLDGTGNTLANRLIGNTGNNRLSGGGGNDWLNGGLGADTLIGGNGVDTLIGGTGFDRFQFGSALATNADRVLDFAVGVDTLVFTALDYGLGAGALLAANFTAGSKAVGESAQFLYDKATRTLSWDADGNGLGSAALIATFDTAIALTNADFILI